MIKSLSGTQLNKQKKKKNHVRINIGPPIVVTFTMRTNEYFIDT